MGPTILYDIALGLSGSVQTYRCRLPPLLSCCSRVGTKAETMQVVVLSATTGELVEHTSSSFWWIWVGAARVGMRGHTLRTVLFCDSACQTTPTV